MGNSKFSYSKYIGKELECLRFFGMWIPTTKTELTNPNVVISLVIVALIFLPNNIAEVMGCLNENQDLQEVIESSYIVVLTCAATLKSFVLFKNRKALATIHCWIEDTIFQPKNLKQIDLAEADLKLHRTVKSWAKRCIAAAVVLKTISPLFYKQSERKFPLPAAFPFHYSDSPLYEVTYVYQSISLAIQATLNIYCEITFSALTTFVGIQCEFICQELEHLEVLEARDIGRIVEHHRRTVLLVKTSNSIFRNIYLVHFASITLAMCMAMFLLTLVEKYDVRSMFLVLYQFAVFFVVLIPCWFASEMQRKGEKIPRAAFCCYWVDASESVKKDLIYFIANAQNPLKFYTVEVFDISISTFIQIIRTAFSYYTMLYNLNKKSKT